MSWLLADVDSGEVLAARDPHARHRPASTIKLLTALLVADELPADRVVVATQADADQEGSRVGLGPGGRYTVRQLLLGLLLVSGNDAAHALAEQLGGTEVTVQKMNQLATRLGAWDTRAATPSGLDGPGMSSSAYDLALVFRRVLHRPLLAELLATQQAEFPGYDGRPGFVVSNDNKLLRSYPGALGGKTGFTDDARHTQVDAAQRGARRLMVVLMRGEQRPVPMAEQAARLLDYGFSLPPAHPVGRLVNEVPQTLPGAGAVALAPPPAGVHAASHGATRPAAMAGSLPVLLWVAVGSGAAATLVTTLATVLARRRHR
jgi:D-alanyl-D-alanine carboxypeptidase (penicillin-binding protein 5/6)